MERIWGPWIAGQLVRAVEYLVDVDAELADSGMPPEAFHASVAEGLSVAGAAFSETWPDSDRRLLAYLRYRPGLEVVPTLRVAGLVLVRASDEAVCLTVGGRSVVESYGLGLTLVREPDLGRYSEGWMLPYTEYLGEVECCGEEPE